MGQFALTATPAAAATTARAAVAAFFRSGDLVQADVLSRILAGGLRPALVLAFGARGDRVDRVEPDVRILQRRRAAAHPGVDVAFAFLAHPATAATAPAAAAAPAVVVIVGSGGFGFFVTATAATATAASAAAVVVLFGAGAGLVVVLVLAVEIGLVFVVAEVVFVLGVFVLVVIGAVVEAVVQVGQVDVAFGSDKVLVRFGALDRVLALGQAVVDLDDDVQAALFQQELQVGPLVVQDVQGHGGRDAQVHRTRAVLAGLDVDGAQGGQGRRFGRTDPPGALAAFADLGRAFDHAQAATLTADLHQAEARDAAHLDAGAVLGQGVLEGLLNRAVVLALVHVDEVDDDQTGQVAQAQLAGGLDGGFQVGLGRRGLDVALLGGAAGVHVDGDQGFGLVDDQIAARLQRHDRLVNLGQHLFDAVRREQRARPLIEVDLLGLRRHQHAHEVAGLLEAFDALDLNAVEVLVVHVAHGAADQVLFLVDHRRRVGAQGQFADRLPQAQQIFIVALDLGPRALGARRADDQAHALRHLQRGGGGLQPATVRGVGDLARDAAALAGVRHQHAVAAGQRQPGGQGRAFGAALVLDDLHQQDLAALDDVLDLVATHQATLQAFLVGQLAVGIGVVGFTAQVVFVRVVVRFGHDGFAVGDGDLIIIRVDFVEGQEAVAVSAVLDEGRLQAGLYAGDLGEIDVPAKLTAGAGFEIEFLNLAAVHDRDAGFFRVRRVYQHGF